MHISISRLSNLDELTWWITSSCGGQQRGESELLAGNQQI